MENRPSAVAVPSLDLLRAAMPVLVLMSHGAIWTGAVPVLKPVFMAGGLAVDVFIFISGFLMLWHYTDRSVREPWNEGRTWCRFWIRRFFRMAPLYWCAFTIMLLTHSPLDSWGKEFHNLYPPPWAGKEIDPLRVDGSPSLGNALAHYFFAFGLIPKYASNNPLPDWSIGLEMQFYFVFPFLALMIRKVGWVPFTLAISAVWIVAVARIGVGILCESGLWGWFPMPSFLPLRIGVFLCGMLAAGALLAPDRNLRYVLFLAASIALAAWHNKWMPVPVFCFYAWEWLCRTSVSLPGRLRLVRLGSAILSAKPVGFAADCSYGVYLWHVPVLLVVMRILVDQGAFTGLDQVSRWGLLCISSLPVVYLLSWITHRWVETPGIAFGKQLVARYSERRA